MATSLSTGTRTRALLVVGTLLAGCAGASVPALAYDDGYLNVFSSVLGAVGVLPGDDAPEIDYRERAPLVLPPKGSAPLVKPAEGGAARSAAWPVDPDVTRRNKASADARAPLTSAKTDKLLSREEQMRFRAEERGNANSCSLGNKHSMEHCTFTPNEARAEEERYKATNHEDKATDGVVAGVEAPRDYLTQPPTGYMKATKTVKATAEAPVAKVDQSSVRYGANALNKDIDPLNR